MGLSEFLMQDDYFQHHKQLLEEAIEAVENRGYYAAYSEIPSGKIYGENAKQDGIEAFEGYKNSSFVLVISFTLFALSNFFIIQYLKVSK